MRTYVVTLVHARSEFTSVVEASSPEAARNSAEREYRFSSVVRVRPRRRLTAFRYATCS